MHPHHRRQSSRLLESLHLRELQTCLVELGSRRLLRTRQAVHRLPHKECLVLWRITVESNCFCSRPDQFRLTLGASRLPQSEFDEVYTSHLQELRSRPRLAVADATTTLVEGDGYFSRPQVAGLMQLGYQLACPYD